MLKINHITAQDYDQWYPLWQQNTEFKVTADVTAHTWDILMREDEKIYGLAAREGSQIVGFLHYIVHPTAGNVKPLCFMQDIFVDPAMRGKGIAKKLLMALSDEGRKQGWARIQWLSEDTNTAAQGLYKNFGFRLNFSFHGLPLE